MAQDLDPDKVKHQNNTILLSTLKRFGIEAQASGRNDLVVNDKKVKLFLSHFFDGY